MSSWCGCTATGVSRTFRGAAEPSSRLTLPSRGCPKGCAFLAPLMSNVRRHEDDRERSGDWWCSVSSASNSAHTVPRANRGRVLKVGIATALRAARQESKPSARAEARARTNVSQSVEPQPTRVGGHEATHKASIALPRGLRLESCERSLGFSKLTPNPSVEGTAKGLRPLSAPHLER